MWPRPSRSQNQLPSRRPGADAWAARRGPRAGADPGAGARTPRRRSPPTGTSRCARAERDQLQQQLADLTKTFQSQIGDAVKSALDHQASAAARGGRPAAVGEERDELNTQIEELKKQAGAAEPVAIPPTMLASQFASVLERFAEGSDSEMAASRLFGGADDERRRGERAAAGSGDGGRRAEARYVRAGASRPGPPVRRTHVVRLLPQVGRTEPPPE